VGRAHAEADAGELAARMTWPDRLRKEVSQARAASIRPSDAGIGVAPRFEQDGFIAVKAERQCVEPQCLCHVMPQSMR